MNKLLPKQRIAKKIRCKIHALHVERLTVHKTPRHIYAQVFAANGATVIAAASSLEKDLRSQDFGKGKIIIASKVGALVAERAKAKGVVKVAFDRSGFKYHGRIKALADSAREHGLKF
jgi:large subunit ribosomal protein L18